MGDATERLVTWVTGLTEVELDEVESAIVYHCPRLHADFYFARTGRVPCGKCHGEGRWVEWMGSGSVRVGQWHPCEECCGSDGAQPGCAGEVD